METTFYSLIRHLHSIIRWLLLSGLLASVILAISGIAGRKGLQRSGRLSARLTLYLAHLQLLAGITLFLISPRVVFSSASMTSPILRFFLVEHTSAMLIAIALITIGYVRGLKTRNAIQSARIVFWFFIFSLIIILGLIPWPFMQYGGHWF